MKDPQQNRVYAWERWAVAPHDITEVLFEAIQPIVNHIWAERGLEFPPQVMPMFKKKTKKADATRIAVRFGEKTYTWIILHELAHAATSLCSGESNHHGALFMGIYLQLLEKYLKLDFQQLVQSARDAGIRVKEDAVPVFL